MRIGESKIVMEKGEVKMEEKTAGIALAYVRG